MDSSDLDIELVGIFERDSRKVGDRDAMHLQG
jgi:hypothetical protein